MGTNADGELLLIGRGKCYFNRRNSDGTYDGERFMGNVVTLEIGTTDDIRERFSSAEASAPLLKRVNVRRVQEMTLTLDHFEKENLALALMGDNAEYTQAVATNAEVTFENVVEDRYYKLPHRNLTAIDSVEVGVTTMTLNVDYQVDLVQGRVYIIPGAGINAGDDVVVTYDAPAITAGSGLPTVRSGVSNTVEGSFRFVGDPATGPTWDLEVWSISFNPDGVLGFIQDDFAEFSIKGAVQADSTNHPTEPFFRAILRAA